MKWKNLNLPRWMPPGYAGKMETRRLVKLFWASMLVILLFRLAFLALLSAVIRNLFIFSSNNYWVIPKGTVMPDFALLWQGQGYALLFPLLAALAIATAFYAYHYQKSHSIYRMRLLPNRWELHRRCLVLPVLWVAAGALLALLTHFICFWLYCTMPPAQCIPTQVWDSFWQSFLEGFWIC